MNDITVVICTHNRLGLLRKCIDSLAAADKPRGVNLNILVVANACTDGTHQFLTEAEQNGYADLTLRGLNEPMPGKSRALNRAIANLQTDWAVLIDDDHRVSADFVSEISAAIERFENAQLFCGKIIPDWTGAEPAWIRDEGPYKIFPPPIPVFDRGTGVLILDRQGELPGGGNLIVHRLVFEKVGRFRTSLGPVGHNLDGSEDIDFISRALDRKFSLYYVPSIVQYHYVDPVRLKLGYLLRKAYQRSRSSTAQEGQCAKKVPGYIWKKLFLYLLKLLTSTNSARARFYLMRLAAMFGELRGLRTP